MKNLVLKIIRYVWLFNAVTVTKKDNSFGEFNLFLSQDTK